MTTSSKRTSEDPAALELRRQALKLDHAERTGGLGSWEWVPETGELVWSPNLFGLYGLEPGEVTPSVEVVLAHVHPDDRDRIEHAVTAIAAGRLGHDLDYRFLRPDGTLRAFRVVVVTVEEHPGADRRVVGSVQDVTVQLGLDRQLAAQLAVTQALDDWVAFDEGAADLLAGLGAALGLAVAVLWVPDGSSMTFRSIWHQPSPELELIAELTQAWRPGLGSAMVGRAFTGRQPVVPSSASAGGPRARNAAVRAAGLQGAVAVPAVYLDETLAVLEFLSFEPVESMDRLVRVLHGIGHEIGHFLSHRRGDLTAPLLTARQLQLLQFAAEGRSAAAIAAELHLSRATVKRHFERAYRSLGVSDRAAAVAEAMRSGLIS
jgi:DNA-binding CsgD family transcriptional regulator